MRNYICFLLLCSPAFADAPKFKVVLSILVNGSDGTLAASRETTLPFVPYVGLEIDLFRVEKVTWSTKREAFVLTLAEKRNDGKARELLRLLAQGDKWEEVFFAGKE